MKSTIVLIAILSRVTLGNPVHWPQELNANAYEAVPQTQLVGARVGEAPNHVLEYNHSTVAATAAAGAIGGTKNDLSKRDGCVVNVISNYAGSVDPPTNDSFLADLTISSIAKGAVAPAGYFLVSGFIDLQASAQDGSYMTFWSSELDSYDVDKCAAQCTATQGCQSFNIYFERDNYWDSDLANCPASETVPSIQIKCDFFGAPIEAYMATNFGQYTDANFHIVIAGSNSYTTSPQPQRGYDGPFSLGDVAIHSPMGTSTYMGLHTFPDTQPYDPAVCALGCTDRTAYSGLHPTANGIARPCVFFDAYMAYKDGANGHFTCTYYADAYDASWATNHGQVRGGSSYTIGRSNTYKIAGFPFAPSKS